MLSTLLDQCFDREDRVEAATVRPEAVLVLVIQRSALFDRFEPNEDDVASNLVRRLEHHDPTVVSREAQVALFGQDTEQPRLPPLGQLFGLPEVLHEMSHEAKSVACRHESLPQPCMQA